MKGRTFRIAILVMVVVLSLFAPRVEVGQAAGLKKVGFTDSKTEELSAEGWTQIQAEIAASASGDALRAPDGAIKLTSSMPNEDGSFGYDTAMWGDVLVVGAYNEDVGGAVYVFRRHEGGADNWGLVQRLTASDAEADDWFGESVAVWGDVIVVGADGEDTIAADAGAAYVFQRADGGSDNWDQVAKLMASDGDVNDGFGVTTAVWGDVIVVGAPFKNASTGAVYVFQRMETGDDAWGEVKKLTASGSVSDDLFGWAVAVWGDTIVAGARGHNNSAGAAFVFERQESTSDDWGEVKTLTAAAGEDDDQLGYSVAIWGEVIAVGAVGEDGAQTNAGAVYLFQREKGGAGQWGQMAHLQASTPVASACFGQSVALWGDRLLVGAFQDDGKTAQTGTAYVFLRTKDGTDTWQEEKKVFDPGGVYNDGFGRAVTLWGSQMAVGAHRQDPGLTNEGAVYVYGSRAETWSALGVRIVDGLEDYDRFGHAVDVSGDIAVVGAPLTGDTTASGKAYVFYRVVEGSTEHWVLVKTLTESSPGYWYRFGDAVAVSGDVIVVANDVDMNENTAYVFQRNAGGKDNWGEVAQLSLPNSEANAVIRWKMDIDGDVIVIGSAQYGTYGVACVFQRDEGGKDNWGQTAQLTPNDTSECLLFGYDVAVSGDLVVVGDMYWGDSPDTIGAVFVFHRQAGGPDAWGEVARLTADGAAGWDSLGHSVAIDGDTIAAYAFGDSAAGSLAGAVYVFQRSGDGLTTWTQVDKLIPADIDADDYFGFNLALTGDVLFASAHRHDGAFSETGAVYVYHRQSDGHYVQVQKIDPFYETEDGRFGESLAASGDVLVVGTDSMGLDETSNLTGIVQFFYTVPDYTSSLPVFLPLILR
jgi:hypothetical protein